jgi:hypothetical protein
MAMGLRTTRGREPEENLRESAEETLESYLESTNQNNQRVETRTRSKGVVSLLVLLPE